MENNAFVIMPFDPEYTPIYEQIIKPAFEEVGFIVRRADSFFDQENILRDIVRGIAEASFVLAEITTPNPNVLYELGLCHGLQVPTVLIAQSMDEVPFDLRSYRTFVYSTQFDKIGGLKNSLIEFAQKFLEHEINFGSPVIDFLPEQQQKRERIIKKENEKSVENDEGGEEQEEGGYLDYILEGSEAAEHMTEIMIIFTDETSEIGQKFQDHTQSINNITNNPGPGSTAQAHRIATSISEDMTAYTEKIEERLPEYESSIEDFINNYSGYINWLSPNSEDSKEQILSFRTSIESMLDGTQSGIEGTQSFRDAITSIKGISKDVNRVSKRLIGTLGELITYLERLEAFCAKSLIILDEKLD